MEELGSAGAFDRMGSVGVEEEFFVVDADGRPVSGTDTLVYESDPPEILENRLDHELFKCVIETQIPTAGSLAAAEEGVRAVRSALIEHAAEHGFGVAAAGLHPAADWRELEHAEKPRYRSQLERIQYPQHRNTTAGVHVHVGVDDADKATWVANAVRWHCPLLLALSANSPYWCRFDTGLESARAKVFEGLPNTGMPTAFDSFEAYAELERQLVESDSIEDRGELWYDVRPHSGHGTVEVRAPDAQADPEVTLAFVEYVHALVCDLAERYEDGEAVPQPRREILDENKWRAIRRGRSASFIRQDGSGTVGLEEAVEREADRLGVDGVLAVLDREGGAARQRRLREESGIDTLCESLLLPGSA